MNAEQKKEVYAFAKEQFAFLKTEKRFTKPLIHQLINGLLIYRNATIGIGVKMHFSFPGYPPYTRTSLFKGASSECPYHQGRLL